MPGVYLEPIYDRILVKREKSQTVSDGGIIIPETAQKKLCRGIVKRTGDGERYQGSTLPMSVKKGDYIVFSENVGTDIIENNDDCVLIRENEVLAIQRGE